MKKSDIKGQAIIMCGISGSGKTFHARNLENEGYIRLSVDALIWEKVGSQLFLLTKEEQKTLFSECRVLIYTKLLQLLREGKKVVVDATHCKRSVRDNIRKLCAEIAVKPTFLYCDASKEELWQRLSQRTGEGPDDLIVTIEELNDYWIGFERPAEEETDFIFLR